jgi:hypothetical protein
VLAALLADAEGVAEKDGKCDDDKELSGGVHG